MLTSDITFDDIVNKTKTMLGDNYKGDEELVPVYSDLISVTNNNLVISNNGFTEDEVAIIKEKTNNYAWWVANKGYLMDDSQQEIQALFIYGSEIGSTTPDVLNFNINITNSFSDLVNKTNNSTNHIYIRFILNDEIVEYETDRENESLININGIDYNLYSGRLYPEDRVIINNDVAYPIYLVSNLEYCYISEDGEIINLNGAHDTELAKQNNLEILQDVCEMVTHEASQWTNRLINTLFLNDCWPVIVKYSCMAYLNRGAEGLNSQSELGQQNVYLDWVELMHKQITNRRYVL